MKLIMIVILVSYLSPNVFSHVAKWTNSADGTHAWITQQALDNISSTYKSAEFYKFLIDRREKLGHAAGRPDITENDFGTFQGHFYDPITGLNWMNRKSPTALTRFINHTEKAIYFYNHRRNLSAGLKRIGYAIHYLEDACVPHHAKNLIAGVSWHNAFEKFADEIKEMYTLDNIIINEKWTQDFTQDITEILTECSIKAYNLADMANNSIIDLNNDQYISVSLPCYKGKVCSQNIPDCDSWQLAARNSLHNSQIAVTKFLTRIILELK